MAKASNNRFPSVLFTEGSAPPGPAVGDQRLFFDSTDHHLKRVDSASSVVDIEAIDAADVTYTPTVATDWDGDVDPGDLDDALNQLAERIDDVEPFAVVRKGVIGFTIDGGGSAITIGYKGVVPVPASCTIKAVRMYADQSGSIIVDIWKDTYANYPPTDADSITAAAVPTITAAMKSEDTTLTGWTTALAEGDVLAFNVDSVTTMGKCIVALFVEYS